MRQSSKTSTYKTTKPVSLDPITTIKQITENASAWPVINGVKQKDGVCYCDGSTLDNSSGKYTDFLAANGSLTVPNGPFRTNTIDLSLSNTPAGWATRMAKGYAYSDSDGDWYFYFSIHGTATASLSLQVSIDGIVLDNTGSGTKYQAFAMRSGSQDDSDGGLALGTNDFLVTSTSSMVAFIGSGTVKLASKPTWADANLESYPVINLQTPVAAGALGLPPASATEAGTVTPEDQTFSGKKTFTETTTGNIFESYSSKTVLSSSSPTLVANGVVNNLSGMYMVTISRSGTGGSYSAMSNAFINITSSSSAVLSHVRQDPDCTITASGGRVFAQASAPYNGQTYKATFVCLMRFE